MEERTTKTVVEMITNCVNLADNLDDLKNTEFYTQKIKNKANSLQKDLMLKIDRDFKTIGLNKATALQLAENIDKRNDLLKVISKLDLPMMEKLIVYADSLLYSDKNIKSQDVEEVEINEDYVNPLEAELNNVKARIGVHDSKKIYIPISDLNNIPMDMTIKDEQVRTSKFRAAVVEYARNQCGDRNTNASDWTFQDYSHDKASGNIIIEFKK